MDKKYDLEERTAAFSENIIDFIKKMKRTDLNEAILSQLIRSSTSVGANYYEAIGASSTRDFRNKIHICKKEIQEIKYWLRIITRTNEEIKEEARVLWREAQELTLIFGKIASRLNEKKFEIKN